MSVTRRLPLLLLALAACEPPPVAPSADLRQNTLTGRIEGTVVVTSAARGRVVLFLYDEARPPPPVGTGRPLSFAVVPREALFGHAAEETTGPFTAPFAFSLVPPGRYLVRGLLDADEDFVPWYGVTADGTQGDVGGAALDLVTRQAQVVEVGMDAAGLPLPALGVSVSFSDAARLWWDRPAFAVANHATSAVVSGAQPLLLELQATPVVEGVVHQAAPAFLVRLVDDDGDGAPDDANGDGAPDVWPRVVVRKLADGDDVRVDENDVDRDGVVDQTGADYPPLDGQPDAVVLAAGFDVSALMPQLLGPDGGVKATPTLAPRLPLVVRPRAFDVSTPARPRALAAPPPGRYALTVIQHTGQTWRVPNELAPGLAEPLGLRAVASQGFVVEVR